MNLWKVDLCPCIVCPLWKLKALQFLTIGSWTSQTRQNNWLEYALGGWRAPPIRIQGFELMYKCMHFKIWRTENKNIRSHFKFYGSADLLPWASAFVPQLSISCLNQSIADCNAILQFVDSGQELLDSAAHLQPNDWATWPSFHHDGSLCSAWQTMASSAPAQPASRGNTASSQVKTIHCNLNLRYIGLQIQI